MLKLRVETKNHPILSIDYGRRYWGFAVSDSSGAVAMPLRPFINRSERLAKQHIHKLIADYHVQQILLGNPVHPDGFNTDTMQRVAKLAAELRQNLGLPVILWNEMSTSKLAALSKLPENAQHSEAARILLQEYLTQPQN
jgi:putative Holliday junction resolvase